jgi:hypothetical protein
MVLNFGELWYKKFLQNSNKTRFLQVGLHFPYFRFTQIAARLGGPPVCKFEPGLFAIFLTLINVSENTDGFIIAAGSSVAPVMRAAREVC